MRLRGPALQHLTEALRIGYPDAATLRRELLERCDRRLDDIVSPLAGLAEIRSQVLEDADVHDWLDRLFAMLAEHPHPSVAEHLRRAVAALEPVVASRLAGEDPFRVLQVAGRPFLDRDDLRSKLTELLAEERRRVLIVTGRRPCGKSYAWPLLDALARAHRFEPVLLDVETLPATERTPAGVVTNIALQLGLPATPPTDPLATEASQAQRLFSWLVGQARRGRDERWLIVVDSIDKIRPPLSPETVELFLLLGQGAADNRIAGMRLVLLGHRKRLPVRLSRVVINDTFDDIGEEAVRAYFAGLVAGGRVEADDAAVDAAVAEVLAALGGCERAERFQRLTDEVERVTARLPRPRVPV